MKTRGHISVTMVHAHFRDQQMLPQDLHIAFMKAYRGCDVIIPSFCLI